MTYLIDADVFISANRLHYGMDFCPAFWDWLIEKNKVKRVFSVEAVKNELLAGKDLLAGWAKARGSAFFLPSDYSTTASLTQLSEWVERNFEPSAASVFYTAADYFLVAYAGAHEHVVVTREASAPKGKRIKIPDACAALGVKCISPFEMLRTEKAKFVL